jgi:hypothetical protein
MFTNFAIKLAIFCLQRAKPTLEQRNQLANEVLSTLAALPLSSIITVKDGSLFVKGNPLGPSEASSLRESARAAMASKAFTLIRDEVLYQAYTFAANKSVNIDQLLFAKAAVWWGQKENDYLLLLSTLGTEDPDPIG